MKGRRDTGYCTSSGRRVRPTSALTGITPCCELWDRAQSYWERILRGQGPAQAQDLRDSLAEAKSDIVVKVSSSLLWTIYQPWCMELSVYMNTKLTERCTTGSNDLSSTRHQTSL
uniref:Uncharacterized protein n=1 Tax=Setaria viridis TaxID=4556 RepID=A0A4U6VHA6_SETVI|nr:hypothetical protein SEVIR_3G214325v2 [Setaria viridis]